MTSEGETAHGTMSDGTTIEAGGREEDQIQDEDDKRETQNCICRFPFLPNAIVE